MATNKKQMREARRLFRFCLVSGLLDESRARRVVQAVLRSRRRGYLTLLGYFQRLVKCDRDQHRAKIESAVPVPADLQATIQDGLAKAYGAGLTTTFALNPALIGGMRIQVGSDVYDGSVQGGLTALEKSFGISGTNGHIQS